MKMVRIIFQIMCAGLARNFRVVFPPHQTVDQPLRGGGVSAASSPLFYVREWRILEMQ